jgi:alpha/beta superfamily hydrolase
MLSGKCQVRCLLEEGVSVCGVVSFHRTQTFYPLIPLLAYLALVCTFPYIYVFILYIYMSSLGGTMHNNVVVAAVLYFQKLGMTTARFDFNGGIGRGYTQVQQVLELSQYLLLRGGRCRNNFARSSMDDTETETSCGLVSPAVAAETPQHILLVGYSYGSLIAGSASADINDCVACISIAPPFSVQHWLLLFHSNYHLEQATRKDSMPRLLLLGSEDNFTSEEAFKQMVETRYPVATTTGAVIKGADHFFRRREKDLMDVIGLWLVEAFPQCGGDLRRLKSLEMGTLSTAAAMPEE